MNVFSAFRKFVRLLLIPKIVKEEEIKEAKVMKSLNELIYDFLTEYANNPDPQYAVMLKGKWGCGKTHFIKQWLKEYKEKNGEIEEDTIDLKPIYVSLYGMNTIAEIKTAIDREVNPFFYSKTGKVVKGVAKVLGKVVLKTNIDFNGDEKDDATFTGSIDSLSLFKKNNEDVVKGVRFIVFDDIERCQIEMKQLLGFINYFVEHCDCKVLVIGDESHLEEESKKCLDEFKEKTVGREFEIKPDDEKAIDFFLHEPHIAGYLEVERDYILKCFRKSESGNLRVLRQCLMDFASQIKGVETGTEGESNLFLHGLLCSFIAVYAELNNPKTKKYIEDFLNFFQNAVGNLGSEEGKAFKNLNQKYYEVSLGNIYNVFTTEYVPRIVKHIRTGAPLTDFIRGNIKTKRREQASWEKLSKFWEMENDQFNSLYDDSLKALVEDKIDLPYHIGTTIGYLGYIDVYGVRSFESDDVKKVKKNIDKRIENCKTLEGLFQFRNSIIQGVKYITMNCDSCPKADNILSSMQKFFECQKVKLPDAMQEALRGLTDETVSQLLDIDDKSYPDHSCAYRLRAIFGQENGEELFERICKLSNKGKNIFCSFLSKHYMFSANIQGVVDYYKSDVPVLIVLKGKIDDQKQKAIGVDKMAYDRLGDALDKALKRCNGESAALV